LPVGNAVQVYSTPVGPVVHTHSDTVVSKHKGLGATLSLLLAVLYACAFYGIHKKAPLTWRLGWVAIAFGFLEFLAVALSSTRRLPETVPPWIASVAIVVGGGAVALYWGLWWNRQKGYFSPRISSPHAHGE
jgi:hypothetical protein